jgi:hypothetical protein
MIAFGCYITEPEPYLRFAKPGIQRAAEADSEVFAFAAAGQIGRSYNLLLDAAAAHDDLEALVLLHPHAEIADDDFCATLRTSLADPDVAVVGCAGATGVRGIAWWEGAVRSAPLVHRYPEHGGGDLPAFAWTAPAPAPGEVETVDGFLLALSPWAVRNVRFDEGLALGTGFDLDYCRQVRAAGRKVLVADLRMVFHRSIELVDERELWIEAHVALARKWEPAEDEWKARARRAEAEREVARAFAHSAMLGMDARVLEAERALERITDTSSWRLTAPLRRLNKWRAERSGPASP